MILPVTLCSAGATALVAMWLGMRVGRVRTKEKILHGDAGHPLMVKRMRAQLNFVEYTPFVLALIAAIELSGKGGEWLAYVAGVYMIARVAHPFGMERDDMNMWRGIGVAVTMLTLLGLAVVAVLIAASVI